MKALLVATLLAAACCADTVIMKDGRKLEGTVTDLGDDYAIKGKFGTVKVKKADVERVETAAAVDPVAKTKPLSGPERALLESAEALLESNQAADGLKSLAPLHEAVAAYDWDGQRRIRLLVSRLELRAGNRDRAAKEIAAWATLAPAQSRVSDSTRARLVTDSADGTWTVKEDDLKAYGGPPPAIGPQPLWDERVVAFALRVAAAKDEALGAKALEDARGFEKQDKVEALRFFRSSEQAYARANDISPGCCRTSQIAAVRGMFAMVLDLAVEADDQQMANSPLNVAFEMKANADGKLRFTPAGRAKFDQTRSAWNSHVERLQAHVKEIDELQKRFPEEVARQQGLVDRVHTALKDMVPKIRAAFAKQAQEHN